MVQLLQEQSATPVVTGELIGAYLYEEGTNYGSVTLDKEVVPKFLLKMENLQNSNQLL